MQNKAIDLNNHLFEQLERLNDTSIKDSELTTEIRRAEAMCRVSSQIISNARMVVDAYKMAEECGLDTDDMPDMLSGGKIPARKLIPAKK
jgi:hypothetical protein